MKHSPSILVAGLLSLCLSGMATAASPADMSKEALITSPDLNVYLLQRDANKAAKSLTLGLLFDYAKPQGGHGVQAARSNTVKLHIRCGQNTWNVSQFQPFAGAGGTGRALAPAHPTVPDNAWVQLQSDQAKVKDPGESLMNKISLGACIWLSEQLEKPAA